MIARGLSGLLERRLRPELRLFGRTWPVFAIFVHLGIYSSVGFGLAMAPRLGLSLGVTGQLAVTGVTGALALGVLTKVIFGREIYTYYHYMLFVLAAAALYLWLSERPVLPYLDVVILGIGLVQAWVRLGCLMAGCCHGRPCGWGIRYGAAHAKCGFSRALVGVRLLPIQAIESLWLFALWAAGTLVALSGGPPGQALAFYLLVCGAARYSLEFARGDDARPFLGGFSEAQWTATLVMTAVVVAASQGVLPYRPWQPVLLAVVVTSALAIVLKRRLDPVARSELLHPHHVSEVAAVLNSIEPGPTSLGDVHLVETSRGLRLSGQSLAAAEGPVDHYCLSCSGPPMGAATAAVVAGLIRQLRPNEGPQELIRGTAGVFHLLAHQAPERAAP